MKLMQNVALHNFGISFDTLRPLSEELDPNFNFEILAKKDGIGTIPQARGTESRVLRCYPKNCEKSRNKKFSEDNTQLRHYLM